MESQCHWCLWLDDGLACLLDVDIEDGLLSHFLGVGLCAKRSHQPVKSAFDLYDCSNALRCREIGCARSRHVNNLLETYQMVATPYLRLVKTARMISKRPC